MSLYESEAIILRTYNLAESDKIFLAFTRAQGTVRGVAKGAKRLKSRFGAALEPFSIVHLEYFQKQDRELASLRNVELLESSFVSISNPEFYRTFSYLCEILTEVLPVNLTDETAYRMVKSCLQTANQNPDQTNIIAVYFQLWILKISGYLPDLQHCEICRRRIAPGEDIFYKLNLQAICRNCKSAQGQLMSAETREVLFSAFKLAPENFVNENQGKDGNLKELDKILGDYLAQIIGKDKITSRTVIF